MAPELIKSTGNINLQYTAASDIYSLAIVMYEVLFPAQELEVFPCIPQYLVSRNLRPNIPDHVNDSFSKCVIKLIEASWDELPLIRTTAEEIFQQTNFLLVSLELQREWNDTILVYRVYIWKSITIGF